MTDREALEHIANLTAQTYQVSNKQQLLTILDGIRYYVTAAGATVAVDAM